MRSRGCLEGPGAKTKRTCRYGNYYRNDDARRPTCGFADEQNGDQGGKTVEDSREADETPCKLKTWKHEDGISSQSNEQCAAKKDAQRNQFSENGDRDPESQRICRRVEPIQMREISCQ